MQYCSTRTPVWPVVVADLEDPAARDFLVGIALASGGAYLPLIAAPTTPSMHILEVYTPGTPEPLVLFATPLGAPTRAGFPMQLRMFDPNEALARAPTPSFSSRDTEPEQPSPASELRPRSPTNITLSARHTRQLSGLEHEPAPEALLGREIAGGKLRVESLIGAGGVGSVYRAAHRDLRMPVAVKVLHHRFKNDLEFCRRFHAEALAASCLDHQNLMRVLDFGQEPDGLLYLAMEHLDGRSLAGCLEVGRGLPLTRIVDLMMQICAGLAHAHSRGIVHRDIKPDNVVLISNHDDDERPQEIVKVCDFGIAIQEADGASSSAVVGTPAYMSPEQCRGEALDGRSDVYSCGVMMYELATGHMPFTAPTAGALLNRHMFVAPVPPRQVAPEVDPRLEVIIMKALAKEASERQASMRDLRRELVALLESESQPPSPGPGRSETTDPEWLERSGSYRHESSGDISVSNVNGLVLAAELVSRPAAWLSAFAEAQRADELEVLASRLEAALPVLLDDRQMKALFAVRSTLDELAIDDGRNPSWRVACARQLQLLFADPAFLAALAEAALADEEPPREVTELVLRIGGPAAYALYSARLKMSEVSGVRGRFVLLVRELGAEAAPMIRAGLARLEGKQDVPVAAALAADLLEASASIDP